MLNKESKVHSSTFSDGLNKDLDKNILPATAYRDAQNIALVESSKFMAVQNIAGTTTLANLSNDTSTRVLAVFPTKYTVGSTEDVPCLTVFTVNDSNEFKILCYVTTTDSYYVLQEKTVPGDYVTDDRAIDAVLYPENGKDILYFTDHYYPVSKLQCTIPSSYTANFLGNRNLAVQRLGANGKVVLTSVTTGGSLLSGSYQICYQLVNVNDQSYSKFSLFCNPIKIYGEEDTTSAGFIPTGGVGIQSKYKIRVDIPVSTDELNNYTHFRLGVLEHIYPDGVENQRVQLTSIEPISTYLIGSQLTNVEYKANSTIQDIALAEVVVDQAAIEAVKTISVRNNRLFGGNIKYKNLEYNNGTPTVINGTILKRTDPLSVDPFSRQNYASNYVGYFRNEVYRFAVSYFDEFGNFSTPKVLNMSSVTHNRISGAIDFKFPKRKDVIGTTRYTIFNSSNNNIQSLGLSLTIDNHPTWAKGFVVLRVPRIKDILFQSPLINMMGIQTPGAVQNYPNTAKEGSGTDVNYDSASPMGPDTFYAPQNFFWGRAMSIVRTSGASGAGVNQRFVGETELTNGGTSNYQMVFPPQTMYDRNNKFVYTDGLFTEIVDAVAARGYANGISSSSFQLGTYLDTTASMTLYSLRDSDYYYNSTHTGAKATLRGSNNIMSIKGYVDFDNFSEGTTLNGTNILTYDKIETPGITWGVKPNAQRCGVINRGPINISPITPESLSFASAPTFIPAQISQQHHADFAVSSTGVHSQYIDVIEVGNVIRQLSDSRYGPTDFPHTFISTGTSYTFSPSDLAFVQAGGSYPVGLEVWGGDCITCSHLFKISDSVVTVTNQDKHDIITPAGYTVADAISRWGRAFTGSSAVLSLPISLKTVNQYIQVVLESEYLGEVVDTSTMAVLTTVNNGVGIPPSPHTVRGSVNPSSRLPLNYEYNINFSKQNDAKTFQMLDPLLPVNNILKSRIIYSDEKVYQTNIQGFDIFKVLNYHDLSETFGGITKLALSGDDLYGIQESGISYIGVGERALETTDINTLQVRSGDVIGNVVIVNSSRGSQNLRGIVNTGDVLYIPDGINRSVYRLADRTLDIISDNGMASEWRSIFSNSIPENQLMGMYDPIRGDVWFSKTNGDFCYIYNDKLNKWISNYQFGDGSFYGGGIINGNLYLIGYIVNDDNSRISLNAASMYTGPYTNLMGRYVEPSVDFIVNSDISISKVFDAVLINSSDRLDNMNVTIDRESALGSQIVNGINLVNVSSRGEGTFKTKLLRAAGTSARPRGVYMNVNVKLLSGVTQDPVSIIQVLTKYRNSENIF